ncbi:MAG: YeeE/YedE family protein, partial [Gammaproteobacteria bacterium]|nr:YeeE/YedE family protein [Gammaproteobacteria bacterium]
FMINPFPGTDDTIYSMLFYPWTNAATVSLAGSQDVGSFVSRVIGTDAGSMRLILGILVGALCLMFVFKSEEFRQSGDNKLAGLVIGLCVIGAWYVSGAFATITADGETHSWVKFASNDIWSMMAEGKAPSGVAVQSYTFINPIGEMTGYLVNGMSGWKGNTLTFGMAAALGVIVGSLIWAIISKGFRIEWFVDMKDFVTHLIGAVLMGIGGVLALGCTVGQAITGASTLAVGSFIAFASIVFGSALTMKIQYYKLVYEEEATFGKALITSLADMKLVPNSLRKLDAV